MPTSTVTTARRLSELEAVVLGLVWSDGPCTAYAVRRTVQASLSAQWSGSAGAVYPAVARLQERGLIRSRDQATGKRRSQALEITAKGNRALADWLRPPIDPVSLGIPPDPLRLRLRFLELLSPADRAAFLKEAITEVEITLDRVRKDVRRVRAAKESPFQIAMALGALHATRARLRTLNELKTSLAG
jgi:DNA-binding PadR family transcriptional regulator